MEQAPDGAEAPLNSGKGDDYIGYIGDDGKDFVDCGPGIDSIDQSMGFVPMPKDVYRNCERIVS